MIEQHPLTQGTADVVELDHDSAGLPEVATSADEAIDGDFDPRG
jgi:hypothetical protein